MAGNEGARSNVFASSSYTGEDKNRKHVVQYLHSLEDTPDLDVLFETLAQWNEILEKDAPFFQQGRADGPGELEP